MKLEQLQVLLYAVKFGGQHYGTDEASHGVEQRYGLELSDDMARLVDKFYNLERNAEYDIEGEVGVHLGVKMIRALTVTRPESVANAEGHIELLNRFVGVIERDATAQQIENDADNAFSMSFLASIVAANPNGTVYVARQPNPDRVEVVHDLNEQNVVVIVDDEDIRESLVDIFDFEELDSVSLAPGALKAVGVSEGTRENILGRTGNVTDLVRTLKYHLTRVL